MLSAAVGIADPEPSSGISVLSSTALFSRSGLVSEEEDEGALIAPVTAGADGRRREK